MRERFIPETKFQPVDFDPFTGPAIVRTFPSTEAQREVWVASRMAIEANCAYIESVSLELHGPLDAGVISRSVELLVDRHGALRSVLSSDGMRMIEMRSMDVPIEFTDLADTDPARQEKTLARIATRDVTLPFDLLNGPLFRTHLVRLAPEHHLLRLSAHHVICDGWSLGVLMADVARIYNALRNGNTPELPPAPSYGDYAVALLDLQHGPAHAEIERYWLDLFQGPLPRVELPTDRPRPRQKTYNSDRLDLVLPANLVTRLRELGTRSGSSFVTTLLTAFEVMVYKLTGDSDLCIGLPAAGQSDMGMEGLVGHCVNLLALRSRMDEDIPYVDHLRTRRTAVLDAFDHQRYTFGTLVRKLNVPREPGRIPLVPVVFNIDMDIDDEVSFDGIRHRFISNPRRFENFELFLNATGGTDGLVLEWSYNTDLFDADTVRGWMNGFITLIERMTAFPHASIAELINEKVPDPVRMMPPREWSGRAVAYPRDKSVNVLFDEVAATHPEKVALVHGEERISYRRLREHVLALTARLLEAGVKTGDRVGLCCERHAGMVVAELAILRTGAAFVPLDHSYPTERLRSMMMDARIGALVTEPAVMEHLPHHEARTILLDAPPAEALEEEFLAPMDSPEGAAYIMFTSGSTGRPKGVVVPHRAIVRLVKGQDYAPLGPDAVIIQLSNVAFDASTFEIWGALLNGGTLVLQPQAKPTLAEVTDSIERHGVNVMFITTGLFNVLVDEQLERLKGLECILTGGEVMSLPHIRKALRVLGPGVLNNIYGPTENTTFSCYHPVNSEEDIGRQVPIGKAIHNTFLYVLDERRQPVPVGMKGELYCGGDGVATGYWDRPELTTERFLPDPFRGGDARMYRTGDLVRWLPDGSIEFIGRADEQVKLRGFRIEPGEVEEVISTYPGVRDRLVMVRNDVPGDAQLVAYIVPSGFDPERDTDRRNAFLDGLREHLEHRLPRFMLPAFHVALREFPLNPNGKVDRRMLPVPEQRSTRMKARHVAPRDGTERSLAGIWCKALGLADIGVHDNFFDLGGHSLIGIQLLGQVERQFGRKLSLRALFEAPTVADFAALLDREREHLPWSNLALVQPKGDLPPLFCVHGDEANHFIPRYLGNDRPFYGFFHQGEDGRALKYTSVERIAEHFIDELRDARPHGPYLLCGYSFGGVVAFEMARQLTEAGEEVPLLVLFDTYAPGLHQRAVASDAKFYDPLKKFIFRGLVRQLHRSGRVLPPRLRHFHIIDTYDQAVLAYRPGPYAGQLTVFKAANSWGPADMGWGSLSTGGLDVHTVPGDHASMIKEPHVKHMVQELAACIVQAEQQRSAEAG